jgi:hypothetical protein
MNAKQIALKLLTDLENSENGIEKVRVIEGKNDAHISKILGFVEYLKSFIPDSKNYDYYTISQEVKDEIKNIIENEIPKTGNEDYKYTILDCIKDGKKCSKYLLQIDGLNSDIIRVLEKLQIDYLYKTDEDIDKKEDEKSCLARDIFISYVIAKQYNKDKINKLMYDLLLECRNNKILEISDTDKLEAEVIKAIERIDK